MNRKALFRFNDTDTKVVNKALKRNEDELTRVLKEIVPGLVGGPAEGAVAAPLGSEDRFVEASQHRLLTRPDAFHVSVLFQPTLAFLDRVSDVIPDGKEFTKGSSTLLDEFVLKIYLPQLEEKVSNLFLTAVNGPDAFQESSVLKELSPQPLVKVCRALTRLSYLCRAHFNWNMIRQP
jgi:exocyst complex component 4